MAILKDDQVLALPKRWQDLSKFTIEDQSPYTEVTGDTRADAARVLLAAKMDENQQLTFITGIDNSDPLVTIEWEITSSGDGAYRFFYFNILFYDVTKTYQIGEVIYVNGTYYTPSVAGVFEVEPEVTTDWANFWSVFDISTLADYIESEYLDIYIYDDIIPGEYEDCILAELDSHSDTELCGVCVSPDALYKALDMEFLLDAAISMNWQEKAYRAETILVEAKKKYCGC